jgi:hypothetical protein
LRLLVFWEAGHACTCASAAQIGCSLPDLLAGSLRARARVCAARCVCAHRLRSSSASSRGPRQAALPRTAWVPARPTSCVNRPFHLFHLPGHPLRLPARPVAWQMGLGVGQCGYPCLCVCADMFARRGAPIGRKTTQHARQQQTVKEHPFFRPINWDDLANKRVSPGFKPDSQSTADERLAQHCTPARPPARPPACRPATVLHGTVQALRHHVPGRFNSWIRRRGQRL